MIRGDREHVDVDDNDGENYEYNDNTIIITMNTIRDRERMRV